MFSKRRVNNTLRPHDSYGANLRFKLVTPKSVVSRLRTALWSLTGLFHLLGVYNCMDDEWQRFKISKPSVSFKSLRFTIQVTEV